MESTANQKLNMSGVTSKKIAEFYDKKDKEEKQVKEEFFLLENGEFYPINDQVKKDLDLNKNFESIVLYDDDLKFKGVGFFYDPK